MGDWEYIGDVNLEYGGVFIRLNEADWNAPYGYCDALRITPCSDAGLQDNAYWIEALTVLRWRDENEKASILSCVGAEDEELSPLGEAEACLSYGLCDPANCFPNASGETIQIGGKDPFHSGELIKPDRYLKNGSDLEGYVRAVWLPCL